MGKLISIWSFICRRKYLITVVAFAVIIGFLDENSLIRRFGYEREISQLKEEIEKYRTDYEENTGYGKLYRFSPLSHHRFERGRTVFTG